MKKAVVAYDDNIYVAICCSVLQYVAVCSSVQFVRVQTRELSLCVAVSCSELQCAAV